MHKLCLRGLHFKQPFEFLRPEVSTAVTIKNIVLWDIDTQLVPNRRHIMCPLQSPAD
jgi:hypothetical protein